MVEDVVDIGVSEAERPAVSAGSAGEGASRNDRAGGLFVVDDGADRCGHRTAYRVDRQKCDDHGKKGRQSATVSR